MSDSIGPPSSGQNESVQKAKNPQAPQSGQEEFVKPEKMHEGKIMGMRMTEEEYHKFLMNEVNTVITAIKDNEKKMHAANEKLKQSIEGGEDSY